MGRNAPLFAGMITARHPTNNGSSNNFDKHKCEHEESSPIVPSASVAPGTTNGILMDDGDGGYDDNGGGGVDDDDADEDEDEEDEVVGQSRRRFTSMTVPPTQHRSTRRRLSDSVTVHRGSRGSTFPS